jgi:hypothetical protein
MSIEKIIASIQGKSEIERANMKANAQRMLEHGNPAQKIDARRLLDELYTYNLEEQKALKKLHSSMPFTSRVVIAFRKSPPTLIEEIALRALLYNPKSRSVELSAACGWDGSVWQDRFSAMAKARGASLWPRDTTITESADFYFDLLVELEPVVNRLTMKPEVVLALSEIGLRQMLNQTGSNQ